jgi:hypothetical protein
MDFAAAEEKVKVMTELYAVDLDLKSDGRRYWTKTRIANLNAWQFSFGKLTGQDIRTCTDGWQLNRAMNQEPNMRTRVYARQRAVEIGELVRYDWTEVVKECTANYGDNNCYGPDGQILPEYFVTKTVAHKYCTAKKREWLEAYRIEAMAAGHHFTEGARVQMRVKFVKEFGYDTQFGYVSIMTLISDDGKVVYYKGTTPPQFADRGAFYLVKGTVKHSEYKGKKQTLLQRLKVEKQVDEIQKWLAQ